MAATGSAQATQAAVETLAKGGNAIDAAAAACFALMVTDPANTSLGGRAQILIRLSNGKVIPIDGATQAPTNTPPLKPKEDRRGYQTAAIPGAPAALERMVRQSGRLRFAQVLAPAIQLAEQGFPVPPRLAQTWKSVAAQLAKDPGAAALFLKPDGKPYQQGETFRQPKLAATLRAIAAKGTRELYRGGVAQRIEASMRANGGYVSRADLAAYRAEDGVLVRTPYRGREVLSAGGRAWGNTLAEMLTILDQFPIGPGEPTAREAEILARAIAQSLADRPQVIGTLAPKPDGLPLERLSSPGFGRQRAAEIRRQLDDAPHDTTHLSVVDAEGNAVSLTTSIGPSFGTRVAAPELGFLYAHSYRMRSDPTPRARDLTEMTPSIVMHNGRPVLVIGGAGSERIPVAILNVISNVIDRGWSLERAMTAPRLFALGNEIRLHQGWPQAVTDALAQRGFAIEQVAIGAARHLGLVHAVAFDHATGDYHGGADPGDSGSSAGLN